MSIISEDRYSDATSAWSRKYLAGAHVLINVVGLTALLVVLNAVFVESVFPVRPGDAAHYMDLAANPFEAVGIPFTYRPLTPFLVYLLPTSTRTGFVVVNLAGIVATGVAFFYYLRQLGYDVGRSYFGVVLFLLSPMLVYNVVNVYLVDVLSFFFLVVALYAVAAHRNRLLVVALTLGVLNKETVLLAVPVFLVYRWRTDRWSAVRRAVPIATPAVVALLAVRLYYGLTDYFSIETIQDGIAAQMTKVQTSVFYVPVEVGSVFGTLWLASLIGVRRSSNEFVRSAMLVLPLTFVQMALAKDVARVLFIGFPIVIPAALAVFESPPKPRALRAIGGLSTGAAVAGVVGVAVVLPTMAGHLLSVSVDGLTFLAVVKILHELAIALGAIAVLWLSGTGWPRR